MSIQKFEAKLEEKKQLIEGVTQYSFEYLRPNVVHIAGGQGIQLLIDGNFSEEIAICGQPSINHGFEILISNNTSETTRSFLNNMEFGSSVEGQAPVGKFTLKKDIDVAEYVFIATGDNIDSMRSMILELERDKQVSKKITLLWGLESVKDFFWVNEFMDLSDGFDNFYFFPILKNPPDNWTIFSGTVTNYLKEHKFDSKSVLYIKVDSPTKSDLEDFLSNSDFLKENIVFHS